MDHSQEYRRQQAMARYLAGDKIEVICRDLHCAKSWLYKWKARYQADNPVWVTSRSTQPQRKPSQTPPPVVERILTLSRTLGHQRKQEGRSDPPGTHTARDRADSLTAYDLSYHPAS